MYSEEVRSSEICFQAAVFSEHKVRFNYAIFVDLYINQILTHEPQFSFHETEIDIRLCI